MQKRKENPVVYYKALKSIIPPLVFQSRKGDYGKIGVIGGSLEYTGAPFFAGIAALKAGADLGHIFCPEEAALAIKSYSPELIVHPLLSKKPLKDVSYSLTSWFHSLVVGPGLGNDPVILQNVKEIIQEAKHLQKNLVIDAGGLSLITDEPDVIAGYTKAILTPNEGEFTRLYNKMLDRPLETPLRCNAEEETKTLASSLGGVTIVRKGQPDIISNGIQVMHCREIGSNRRCSGQGDVLSGIAALFSFWAAQAEHKLQSEFSLTPTLMAAYGSCVITRKCAYLAFRKQSRAMVASDLIAQLPEIQRLFY